MERRIPSSILCTILLTTVFAATITSFTVSGQDSRSAVKSDSARVVSLDAMLDHDIDLFIHNYPIEFYKKREVYSNTSLTYIPCIMNLYFEKEERWLELSIAERKDSLFHYISKPILINDFAINKETGEYYRFPLGFLEHNNPRGDFLSGPIGYKNWYSVEIILPIAKYLEENDVSYIFTIEYIGNGMNLFWTIEANQVFVLLYNKENRSFHKVEANVFLSSVDSNIYFTTWTDETF